MKIKVRRVTPVLQQVSQFCLWLLGSTYTLLKRRALFSGLAALCIVTVVFLARWGILCVNIQSWWHVRKICQDYVNGVAAGNLCSSLCLQGEVSSLSCQNFYMGKEAVFAATWGNSSVVLKSPKKMNKKDSELLFWLDDANNKHYPTNEEFTSMLKTNVKVKFNMSISDTDAKKMTRFHNIGKKQYSDHYIEMSNVWFLSQDNEYLALILYEKFDIFPKLMGSCGLFFAVQKLNSVLSLSHLLSIYSSRVEWERRVRIAIMVLDYLYDLEHKLPEPLHICDVKMNHFGVTDDLYKIKYLDLDSVHPRSVINRITADGSDCKDHSDCDFFDCRSFCNKITFKCQHGVANNNLQIVCERIFLGWAVSGRILVPGLLLGPHTPVALIHMLQTCANPYNEQGMPRAASPNEMRKKIYNFLIRLNT